MVSILNELCFDPQSWLDLSAQLKRPLVILSPDSSSKDETESILNREHYSSNYELLNFTDLLATENSDYRRLSSFLNSDEIDKALVVIKYFFSISFGKPDFPNGVFILIRAPGVATMLHKHTLDVIQNAGPQQVYWWNESGTLPKFWFEIENEKHFWPASLDETNRYELDTKVPHAGEVSSEFTIFFITFGRTFADQ